MKKRRFGLLLAWVAATATATLLASQAVALVRDQVTDRPSRVATTLALGTTTSTTVAPLPTTQASVDSSTTTATLPETTTTTLTGATTTSSTTVPTTTSTTITAPTSQEETFHLTGGWAAVRCANNEVILTTYAPNPGYQVDIESAGPVELEIKFEEAGGEHESQLKVRCSSGVLDPKIDEHDDD